MVSSLTSMDNVTDRSIYRAAEKCTEQAPSGNGSTSTGELPKEQPSPESPAGDSDRSLTPDHLRGPTPEYL